MKLYDFDDLLLHNAIKQKSNRYNSGQFGVSANESESDKELRQLRKENKHLRMENDILKQAALILGRKGE